MQGISFPFAFKPEFYLLMSKFFSIFVPEINIANNVLI